jgi:hypothetical protein
MGDEPASSAKAPGHSGGEGTLRRLGWPFACGWLALIACVEFGLSWFLPEVGQSLTGPAFVVAVAGLGLGLLGYFGARVLNNDGKVIVPASVRRALGAGTFALPVLGFWSNFSATSQFFLPATGTVTVVAAVVFAIGWIRRRRNATDALFPFAAWMLGVCSVMALACYLYLLSVPMVSLAGNGLFDSVPVVSLKFVSTYEPRLEQLVPLADKAAREAPEGCISGRDFPALPVFGTVSQVCVYGKDIEFDAPSNSYAYAYLPNGDAEFSDSCVLHLDGPWWEASQGVVGDESSCPGGFTYIGP